MLDMGYPREAVTQYLNKNELNNATAAYWLLQMAQQQASAEAAVGAGEPWDQQQEKRSSRTLANPDNNNNYN